VPPLSGDLATEPDYNLTRGTAAESQLLLGRGAIHAACSGIAEERMMGLEPTTFCMASRRSSQLSYIRPAH
jgi:hypothetical protein